MIKLTQILNESESNLSYLDNKVYRKYLNVLNTKYPELQNEVKKYVYPEWGQVFDESTSYNKIIKFDITSQPQVSQQGVIVCIYRKKSLCFNS